jgi:hypothetical protein
MDKAPSAVVTALEEAAKGLLFQSEADYSLEAFLWEGKADGKFTAPDLLALKKYPPDTPVKTVSLARFFQAATKEEDWHNAEEQQTVKRFQALVETLKKNLRDITVFKVGEKEMDVYIVGKTKDGQLAGLSTKVVET